MLHGPSGSSRHCRAVTARRRRPAPACSRTRRVSPASTCGRAGAHPRDGRTRRRHRRAGRDGRHRHHPGRRDGPENRRERRLLRRPHRRRGSYRHRCPSGPLAHRAGHRRAEVRPSARGGAVHRDHRDAVACCRAKRQDAARRAGPPRVGVPADAGWAGRRVAMRTGCCRRAGYGRPASASGRDARPGSYRGARAVGRWAVRGSALPADRAVAGLKAPTAVPVPAPAARGLPLPRPGTPAR